MWPFSLQQKAGAEYPLCLEYVGIGRSAGEDVAGSPRDPAGIMSPFRLLLLRLVAALVSSIVAACNEHAGPAGQTRCTPCRL